MVQFIIENFGFFPAEFVVVVISALPIVELRGGLPVAYIYYDFPFWKAFLLSVFGNLLPVIPLLMLFHPISNWLIKFKWYETMFDWLYHRTINKSKNIEKYGALGLILFTAIPFPTTGAYSACIAAALFAIRTRYAFSAIAVGVVIAGVGIGVLSYSVW